MLSKLPLTLEIEVEFDILDPLASHDVPLQVDITGAYIRIPSSQSKSRRVNILSALSESEVINLEDEILTPEFVENYFRVQDWRSKHE